MVLLNGFDPGAAASAGQPSPDFRLALPEGQDPASGSGRPGAKHRLLGAGSSSSSRREGGAGGSPDRRKEAKERQMARDFREARSTSQPVGTPKK